MNARSARWIVPKRFWAPLGIALLLASRTGSALVWPDVEERVERDLGSADPAIRKTAAHDLRDLGPIRGVPLALAALEDSDDDVRLAAADAAMDLGASGATDTVIGWLNAPDARLRRKACEVARRLPSPHAVAPLARTLGDPDPDVRGAAADALGRQGLADAVAPLLGRLDDPNPGVRVRIVAALAHLENVRAVVPLVGKVQDSSPEVRQAVAHALGDLGDHQASSALVLALRDPIPEVRREAIVSLGRMRASDATDALAPFMSERSAPLRLAAIAALGRIATPDAVRVLVGALGVAEDASGSVEHTPVRDALVAAGGSAVAPLHALLAGSPSAQTATGAAWVLGELHATAESSSIVDAMRRGALPAASALHALAGAGGEAEVPVVLEFVTDPNALVRQEADRAAMALLDPDRPDGRAVEPLALALHDPHRSSEEQARIASLLGRTGARRAALLLAGLLHAHELPLRLAAIDALATLPPAHATESSPAGPGGDADGASDEALLDALRSSEPGVRMHAAIALSAVGTAHARDALLALLDGSDPTDRAAVLAALGGVLARHANEDAVARLALALTLAAGAERDAFIAALGQAPLPRATRELKALSRSEEPADRRTTAALLAAHPGDPDALLAARSLLTDRDEETRTQAAFSLGTIGDGSDVAVLARIAREDSGTATNAVASVARICARNQDPKRASQVLCSFLAERRTSVRANAVAGLALTGASCGDGAAARALLADDPSEEVRRAAALAVGRGNSEEDRLALDRCIASEPSGTVAARCTGPRTFPTRTHATLVYVVPEGSDTPRPNTPYAILFADGLVRTGLTDRRGALFDPVAPEGEVTLRRPSDLVAR